MYKNSILNLLKIFVRGFFRFFLCFKRPKLIKQDNVTYIAQWEYFKTNRFFFHNIFKKHKSPIKVLGPFHTNLRCRKIVDKFIGWPYGISDFYISSEPWAPEFDLAVKQIGTWRSFKGNKNVFRFPAWMWHLKWSELQNFDLDTNWYDNSVYTQGLSIERLMKPILDTYSHEQLLNRANKALMISSHFKYPRKKLYLITNKVIGCDGFGLAFKKRNLNFPKIKLQEKYSFSLCPENTIYDGYISEKITDSFHSGCIPISWCDPEDLKEDFNPNAVINLYNLDNKQCEDILKELSSRGQLYKKLLSEPLLLKRPSLKELINFINL
ncbi:MAG: hypothetical protein CBB97_04045 [Candidatus Endolissoclinum sp. TMED37]|nr:MAG: hypothetical protein CBB97_04045 [Candidatus Endolissoclinum sp. TMED37]|tara:strand:+ start:1584 stop:2555 length:972 start_codon:yes stop_codon:yes gene_type:complete